jgi:hypothetical protein
MSRQPRRSTQTLGSGLTITAHIRLARTCAFAVFWLTIAAPACWSCSISLPEPTLREHFIETELIYMARLVSFKSSTMKSEWPGVPPGSLEEATFDVLMTLKGAAPKQRTIKIRTEYWGGNCTLSIRRPADIIGKDGKRVRDAFADVWILFLSGKEPFQLLSTKPSRPINLYREVELRFLLHETQSGPLPNTSLERTRE